MIIGATSAEHFNNEQQALFDEWHLAAVRGEGRTAQFEQSFVGCAQISFHFAKVLLKRGSQDSYLEAVAQFFCMRI